MSSPRSCHLLTDIRGVCYSAFATPNLGITWAVVSLLGGLICLTYKRYNRRSFDKELNMSKSKAGSCYEPARHEDGDRDSTYNLPLTPEMKETAISSIERLSEPKKNGAPKSPSRRGRCESDRGAPIESRAT